MLFICLVVVFLGGAGGFVVFLLLLLLLLCLLSFYLNFLTMCIEFVFGRYLYFCALLLRLCIFVIF